MCKDRVGRAPQTSAMRQPAMTSLLPEDVPAGLGPLKTGDVYMFQPLKSDSRPVRVVLSVYANSFDRYAVVSQDRRLCRDCGYINLRTSAVSRHDRRGEGVGFQIVPTRCDGPALIFRVVGPDELNEWLDVLRQSDDTAPEVCPVLRRPRAKLDRPPRPPSVLDRVGLLPALQEDVSE